MASPPQATSAPRKKGYPRLAAAMTWDPSMMIFPRFRAANLLSLLSLQAEITALEERLTDVIERDNCSQETETKCYSVDFDKLREAGPKSAQWELQTKLRALLKEYSAEKGQQWDIRGAGAKNWFPVEHGGRPTDDLVILASDHARVDPYVRWGTKAFSKILPWVPCFGALHHIPFSKDEEDNYFRRYWTNQQVRSFGDKVTSIIVIVLILIPVIVLHFLQDPDVRLAVLVIFSVAFVVMMTLLTNATRSELVGAAAAFVAVQVVYVGSTVQGN